MPFRDARGGDLAGRIEVELRERIEEALDAACLDTLVRVRQARRLPPLQADNPRDREAYESELRTLLERLHAHLSGLVAAEPGTRATRAAGEAGTRAPGAAEEARPRPPRAARGEADPLARLMDTQVVLARSLPDYWQRFDAIRIEYAEERAVSGGESRGLLGRLFRRS
jgi:hypothetical protein